MGSRRLVPEYKGIDPEIAPYINNYLDLANFMQIKFKNKVTIGFKDINSNNIIGECNYGFGFREIDIDRTYWARASVISRSTLIFHEASHCYCGRIHDYGKDKEYVNLWEGRFDDFCPKSVMYPTIVSDDCVKYHYLQYIQEIFDRCQPY
jgi:hypothetical protein